MGVVITSESFSVIDSMFTYKNWNLIYRVPAIFLLIIKVLYPLASDGEIVSMVDQFSLSIEYCTLISGVAVPLVPYFFAEISIV